MNAVVKTFEMGKYDVARVNATYGLDDGDYILIQILSVETDGEFETKVTALMSKKD